MNKFWIILFHTYLSKLKTKSFIITTIITALLVLGLTNIETIIKAFDKDEVKNIAVIDETGQLYAPFEQTFSTMSSELQIKKFEGTKDDAENKVDEGEYEGILVLSESEEGLPQGVYKAPSITDSDVYGQLEQALQQLKVAIATEKAGLSPEQITELYAPVTFDKVALSENAKTEDELNQARVLVYILLFFIYFAVIMYASMIAMEVATEKSSRVMEILISSVSPIKQMFGKILGIALLSLTQVVVIVGIGFVSIKQSMSKTEGGIFEAIGFDSLPVSTFVYAVVFFILGYFLFATLAAFLGSLVSRIEDVQQMITPMTMLIIAAFMIAMFGLSTPEASFIKVTSFIPFFTPMIMFLRVGMLTIPAWEIGLSIGILVLTIVLLAIFGARVYRGGVLMYGKSSSFKDIKKALQLTKNEK
ncbi:ABC transporter permease [Ferdinandcohnia quinoae]|uniref:ABC transporter permease n=1 Tax=Fredinandcohnia quinoae TaxID=2918902 RepID=A0AAW5E2I9_9BACI|nr:ABC transporter permease [Fredinandcohnia sp. SECRCQ15]MCH1627105.1 ABC transporter permease [Fredinandcohnia sp. SECRCQ15]